MVAAQLPHRGIFILMRPSRVVVICNRRHLARACCRRGVLPASSQGAARGGAGRPGRHLAIRLVCLEEASALKITTRRASCEVRQANLVGGGRPAVPRTRSAASLPAVPRPGCPDRAAPVGHRRSPPTRHGKFRARTPTWGRTGHGGCWSASRYRAWPCPRLLCRTSSLAARLRIRHAGTMWPGLDSRTTATGALGVLLAAALGGAAGHTAGVTAGVLAALAGVVPSAVLAATMERRSRNAARAKRRQELLEMFAPPKPTGESEDGE